MFILRQTIDNDVDYIDRSFGFASAVEAAQNSIHAAKTGTSISTPRRMLHNIMTLIHFNTAPMQIDSFSGYRGNVQYTQWYVSCHTVLSDGAVVPTRYLILGILG
jgi:hypothetical protein